MYFLPNFDVKSSGVPQQPCKVMGQTGPYKCDRPKILSRPRGKLFCLYVSFKNIEFFKYGIYLKDGIWELLRHEEIPETHVLPILLAGNAWLFYGKKIYSCISSINELFQNI